MLTRDLQDYLRRVTTAGSIAEVNAALREAVAENPDDPDLEGLKNTATMVEVSLIESIPDRALAARLARAEARRRARLV